MADAIHATAESRLFDKLERDEFDSGALRRGLAGRFAVIGAVLKAQGAVARDLNQGRNLAGYGTSLFLATALLTAAYGAILGMFQPGIQTLYAAAKLPIVVLGTALLCTPTFYVFNSILGSRFTFAQTLTAVLFMAASASVVLVAFAPIAWFFTVSTQAPGFLRVLHLGIALIACLYGMRALHVARRYLTYVDATQTPIHGRFLYVWFLIVTFVSLQMAWFFRPLLVPGPFHAGERGLFFDALATLLAGGPTR